MPTSFIQYFYYRGIYMKEKNLLIEGNPVRILVKFALPFLFSSVLQALYGAADLFIVGQYATSIDVSGVAIGSQVMQTLTAVILGITTGGTILIGQYLGAKKERDVAKTIGTFISFFSIFAFILTLIMVFSTNIIVKAMNTPLEAQKTAYDYLFICSMGLPFIMGYNILSGILRGIGNSRTPLIFVLVACVVNIGVDVVLVKSLGMGAKGAALATISAQGISFLLGVLYIWKNKFPFKFTKKNLWIFPKKLKYILRLGLPIALQDGLIGISFLIITRIINNMGVIASASVGVVEKIIVFAMLPTSSIAAAIAVITAQNIGAGKENRARRMLKIGIGVTFVLALVLFGIFQISPEKITGFFTIDKEVVYSASQYLKSYSTDCLLVCFIFNMNSFFSGAGSSLFPMIHSLIATFIIRIPLSLFLSKIENVTLFELGLAAPIATFFSLIMCIIYMKKWKFKERV